VKKLMLQFLVLAAALAIPAFADNGKNHAAVDPDDAYKNNCMRCHSGTPNYSPRMTQTILMHMRVRANLPQDEAEAILKYLQDSNADAPKKHAKTNSRPQTNATQQKPQATRQTGGQ
jgi:hypothetical protein